MTMNRALLHVSLIAVACGGEALDVGNTDPSGVSGDGAGATSGTGGTIDPGMPLPEWPAPDACVATSNLDIVGVWQGAIQDMQFRNRIPLRIEILGASELGGVCGTLRWGEGELPPPPTDPERGWPDDERVRQMEGAPFFYEGATFTILDGGARDDQARFRVVAAEFWNDWCAILTPHWDGYSSWRCMPDHNGFSYTEGEPYCELVQEGGPDVLLEVGKCVLCAPFAETCECNQAGCGASPSSHAEPSSAEFDLVFEADRATGTVQGGTYYTDVLLSRAQ
jgi:hypothetical protein